MFGEAKVYILCNGHSEEWPGTGIFGSYLPLLFIDLGALVQIYNTASHTVVLFSTAIFPSQCGATGTVPVAFIVILYISLPCDVMYNWSWDVYQHNLT